MNTGIGTVKRNTFILVAIASIILNCILSILLYQRSTISTKSSAVYALFLDELQGAMQSSDMAIKDTGKQIQYDVNQQNQYVSGASDLLEGMEPEMMQHGIDVSYVVNALELSYVPNLGMSNIVEQSHLTINEIYTALKPTDYKNGRVSQLRKAIAVLNNKLS